MGAGLERLHACGCCQRVRDGADMLRAAPAAACPRDSRWLMVTNGDNDYDPGFMSELVAHEEAEAVAFDYYSRFQRSTGAAECRQAMTHSSRQ